MSGAYLNQNKNQITNTLKILRYFRNFLKSNYDLIIDPYSDWTRDTLTKEQAQKNLQNPRGKAHPFRGGRMSVG